MFQLPLNYLIFEDIFVKLYDPSTDPVERMLALHWQEFEHFVEYVFYCAGYSVENVSSQHIPHGDGVDLQLYPDANRSRVLARVEVRQYASSNLIDVDAVSSFWGKVVSTGGRIGYLVTTSDFTGPAYAYADRPAIRGKLRLLNKDLLLRYMSYISGSRHKDENGLERIPVPTSPDTLFEADIWRRNLSVKKCPRVLIVSNNKGGVGKTTTVLNLGVVFGEVMNQKILLIDMDGQCSLTHALPYSANDNKPYGDISDYFSRHQSTLSALVAPTEFKNVSIIRSSPGLHQMDFGGSAHPQNELQFAQDLHSDDLNEYDWIILDTPPARTRYTRAALAAADYLMIPAKVEEFAIGGISGLLQTLYAMKGLMGKHQKLIGCVLTQWRDVAQTKKYFPKLQDDLRGMEVPFLQNTIPFDDRIEQAIRDMAAGKKRTLFSGREAKAAVAYRELTKEIATYVNNH